MSFGIARRLHCLSFRPSLDITCICIFMIADIFFPSNHNSFQCFVVSASVAGCRFVRLLVLSGGQLVGRQVGLSVGQSVSKLLKTLNQQPASQPAREYMTGRHATKQPCTLKTRLTCTSSNFLWSAAYENLINFIFASLCSLLLVENSQISLNSLLE